MKFAELQLVDTLKNALAQANFSECTPIQSAVIPLALRGKDISGLAQTGTGKTAAFLIPLMNRILRAQEDTSAFTEEQLKEHSEAAFANWKKPDFCLILVPTRELAEQVTQAAILLGEAAGLKSVSIYGGVDADAQKKKITAGVEFVIATPGRLIDLYKSHVIDLKMVRAVVFDEADRMFDMGFKEDMQFILQRIPEKRQYLVFSATLNFDVDTVAYEFGAEPIECHIDRDNPTADNVEDAIFHVGTFEKPQFLLSILKKSSAGQTIIFSNFRHNIDRIVEFLNKNGFPAMGISSLLNQSQRNRVLEQFKAVNQKNILVATDVAARGLDVKGVDLVINYELPDDAENYVHRIGRTGRAGEKGKAFSLVSDNDVKSLDRIHTYLKRKVEIGWMEDVDLIKDFQSFPRQQREDRGDRDGGRSGGGDRGPRRDGRGGGGRGGGRDFKRGSGGDRDRKPRDAKPGDGRDQNGRPLEKPRGPRRDDNRPNQSANGKTPQHRHGGKPGQKPGQGPRPPQKPGQGAKHPNKKFGGGKHPPRGSQAGKNKAAQAGTGSKVKSFFKKIFGLGN